jgi:HNH endonuclease
MRPVERGAAPANATTYEAMSPTLFARLGRYCSYCEFPLEHVPHAEHIVPKDRFPPYRDRWDNLLVACTWCNSHKGKVLPRPQDLADYLWPTTDNTARAFRYANAIPVVDTSLAPAMQDKAARLRGCVKLGVADDLRASRRAAVLTQAQTYCARLASSPDPSLARDLIVALAVKTGFFSVWMEVFEGDPSMRQRFIRAFEGTAVGCFDPLTALPIQRQSGQI